MLPFLRRIYPPKVLFFTSLSEDPPGFAADAGGAAGQEKEQLGCSSRGEMKSCVTSADSSECSRGSSGVLTIYRRPGRNCGWERAEIGMDLFKNWIWGEKTGQGEGCGD